VDVRTIPDLLRHARAVHRKADAFLVKRDGKWRAVSIDEFAEQVTARAGMLRALRVGRGDRVAILSENRIEWAVTDFAIVSLGAITVPVYPTLIASQVAPLLADAGVSGAFVSNQAQIEKLESIRSQLPTLRWIRCFDREPFPVREAKRRGRAGGASGSAVPGGPEPTPRPEAAVEPDAAPSGDGPGPDDVATIIYTSGTSGTPKGVMLTHRNLVSNALACLQAFAVHRDDTHISFLPLSHVFERTAGQFVMIYAGATIAYAESIERVALNIPEIRPTVLLAVPRFYEKLIDRAMEVAAAARFPRRHLAFWGRKVAERWAALQAGGERVPRLLALQHAIAARIVYPVLDRRLGGRVRLPVSGGAALPRATALFFYGIGHRIQEGYGLTETSPVIAVNTATRYRLGTVGPPLPGVEVRIGSDGEILVRGPSIMKGYWNRPEETAAALEGGWFHTGDIGAVDAEGLLSITDRKKDVLVTSGGKKIAPQPIENALRQSPRIAEAIVVGDGRNYATALIAPANGATREAIAEDVARVNSTLAPFETIKRFELIADDLSVENGHLTPTLKVKRRAVAERYRELIDRMYHGS
jgi:long-chain acyl-CoA synthetase